MQSAGKVVPRDGQTLTSSVVPFGYGLIHDVSGPQAKIIHIETGQEWVH